MRTCTIYLCVWLAALLVAKTVEGQTVLRALPNRQSIVIGEPVQLHLELRMPARAIYQVVIPDSPQHWVWIDKGRPLLSQMGDMLNLEQDLTFTGYDTGYWPVPAIELRSGGLTYTADTAGVRVQYAFADTREAFRDIRDIEAVTTDTGWARLLLIFGLPLLLLGLWVWYRYRNRQVPIPEAVPAYTGFSEFTAALDQLEHDLQQQRIELKPAYIRLSNLFREFLLWKKGLDTREQTTLELIGNIKREGITENIFQQLSDALQLSDFVKFARYQPDAGQIRDSFQAIRQTLHFMQNPS